MTRNVCSKRTTTYFDWQNRAVIRLCPQVTGECTAESLDIFTMETVERKTFANIFTMNAQYNGRIQDNSIIAMPDVKTVQDVVDYVYFTFGTWFSDIASKGYATVNGRKHSKAQVQDSIVVAYSKIYDDFMRYGYQQGILPIITFDQ